MEFLNVQMRPAQVVAVELKHYIGEHLDQELRTLVSRVIGISEAARSAKGQAPRRSYEGLWATASDDVKRCATTLFDWAERSGLATPVLKSTRAVALPGGRAILWFWLKPCGVQFDLERLEEAGLQERVASLREKLERRADGDVARKYLWLTCDVLTTSWQYIENEILPDYASAHRRVAGGPEMMDSK